GGRGLGGVGGPRQNGPRWGGGGLLRRPGPIPPRLQPRCIWWLYNAAPAFAAASLAEPPNLRSTYTVPRGRSRETSSRSSPARPGQTTRAPDPSRLPQFARETPPPATFRRTAAPASVRIRHAQRWTYRSLRPCRIARHAVRSSPTPGRKDTSPCDGKRESDRARESLIQSVRAASQSFLLPLRPALRCTREHLDEVIVQGIVELPLKSPLELRMVQIPRMQFEVVRMHVDVGVFESDDGFHSLAF